MSIIEYTRAARCKDCKYYEVKRSKSFPPYMVGRINGIDIENFKCEYVHQYQHLLRLCGLNELANNFKVV